jgi:predicted RNA-binding Zn ribbon-like protein
MNESPRSWVLAEEPVPVRLMGTIWADTDGLHDDLDTPFGLDAWMDAVGIHHSDTLATPEELVEARALRDSLRRLAAHQTDDTRPAAVSGADLAWSVDVLNAAAARLPAAQLRIENNAFRRATQNPAVPAALAGVAAEAVDLFSGTDADKLRACQAPGCVLYFVKTHPRREWCSIACGNRARAARHYHRRRQATTKPRTN